VDPRLEETLLLYLADGFCPSAIDRLLTHFPEPGALLGASEAELTATGLAENAAAAVVRARLGEAHRREIDRARAMDVRLLTAHDGAYPDLLRTIHPRPPILWVRGDPGVLSEPAVAVVGARRCTSYGRLHARRLAGDLAAAGLLIASGLARGVDTEAHRGALRAHGRCVAVLGSGINVPYPAENRGLLGEIAATGAVVSEFPLDTPPLAYNFPRRNRLISGLALGVLVVEASVKSGSFITADWALDQGREVFAVPGNVESDLSRGTHRLLRQGAKLVETAQDILEELPGFNAMMNPRKSRNEERPLPVGPREEKVLACLSSEPIHLDRLVECTALPVSVLSAVLTLLEIRGLVTQLPGKWFAIDDERAAYRNRKMSP